MSDERKLAVTLAGLVVASALLTGCGEATAVPMDDEYSGNSGETAESQQSQSDDEDSDDADTDDTDSADNSSDDSDGEKEDTGIYADGEYAITGQYGPVGEDTIDVYLTLEDGVIADVDIVGHPFTTISKNHQDAFAEAIGDVVVGKELKGLIVDTVAGASWTTDAFNAALDVAREEASIEE